MTQRILLLNLMVNREMSNPVAQWSRLFRGVPFETVHVPSGEPIPSFEGFSHLIISGSEASIVEPEPWMHETAGRIRAAVDGKLAILGNCFGHQLLAWTLSGAEFTRRAPQPEVGWIEMNISEEDPLLAGVPRSWHSFAFHLDEVCNLPSPWRTLASNASCAHQAIRYGARPIWGIQPHPEITPKEGMQLMLAAKVLVEETMPERLPELQAAIDQEPRDDHAAQTIVDNFLAH